MKGTSVNLNYKPQNIDLLNLIGIEAECLNKMNVTTNFTEKIKLAPSPVYCSNIRGRCKIPFEQTLPHFKVQFWVGVTDF